MNMTIYHPLSYVSVYDLKPGDLFTTKCDVVVNYERENHMRDVHDWLGERGKRMMLIFLGRTVTGTYDFLSELGCRHWRYDDVVVVLQRFADVNE